MRPHLVVIEHQSDCSLGRFERWLRDAGCGLEVRRPYLGEDVGDLGRADGLVVLGGVMNAYEDDRAPWLPAVRAMLRDAVDIAAPVLGICLGSQLLAVACGGRVERGADGTEDGVVDVHWTPAAKHDPLVAGLPDPFPAPSMHDDAVVELPSDAVLLGSTVRYPHQVFRVGTCAWGVQAHPELSPQRYDAWARAHPTVDPEVTGAEVHARDREVRASGALLAGRFAVVARSGRAARSLAC